MIFMMYDLADSSERHHDNNIIMNLMIRDLPVDGGVRSGRLKGYSMRIAHAAVFG